MSPSDTTGDAEDPLGPPAADGLDATAGDSEVSGGAPTADTDRRLTPAPRATCSMPRPSSS